MPRSTFKHLAYETLFNTIVLSVISGEIAPAKQESRDLFPFYDIENSLDLSILL